MFVAATGGARGGGGGGGGGGGRGGGFLSRLPGIRHMVAPAVGATATLASAAPAAATAASSLASTIEICRYVEPDVSRLPLYLQLPAHPDPFQSTGAAAGVAADTDAAGGYRRRAVPSGVPWFSCRCPSSCRCLRARGWGSGAGADEVHYLVKGELGGGSNTRHPRFGRRGGGRRWCMTPSRASTTTCSCCPSST